MRYLSTSFRIAAVAAVLCCAALIGPSAVSSVSAGAVDIGGTPLPPGWELCILQGLTAPATAANVANLDEWQAVEGGSTANTAAFNPFNTRRTTDLHGTPLPDNISANGFPAFVDWLAGCAATVATLEQQNMWAIDVALRAGGVSPPGAFLASVDQTQWCAPSGGQPCYLAEITGSWGGRGLGADGLPALVRSSALGVYGDVRSELGNYELALAVVASDQTAQSGFRQALVSSDAAVASAQSDAARVEKKLGTFALAEYVSGNLFEGSVFLGGTDASIQSQQSAAANQYTTLTAAQLVTTKDNALAAVARAQAERDNVAHQLDQATSTLASDTAAESRTLMTLLAAESTLQTAGACTAVPTVATPANNPSAPSASSPGQAVTTTSDASSPTTTTTTTTLPTSSTTSTSSQPATSSSTTTTTNPPPIHPNSTQAETANSAGIVSLQGCVASFTPGAGA